VIQLQVWLITGCTRLWDFSLSEPPSLLPSSLSSLTCGMCRCAACACSCVSRWVGFSEILLSIQRKVRWIRGVLSWVLDFISTWVWRRHACLSCYKLRYPSSRPQELGAGITGWNSEDALLEEGCRKSLIVRKKGRKLKGGFRILWVNWTVD